MIERYNRRHHQQQAGKTKKSREPELVESLCMCHGVRNIQIRGRGVALGYSKLLLWIFIVNSAGKVVLSQWVGEVLDGIAQHGTRHLRSMKVEEFFFYILVSFSHLAQHPAHCFVYQVVSIAKQQCGHNQAIAEVVTADEMVGGDDGHASLPD